ncbi:unnamed protein product [Sphagnum balticum]
MADWEAKGAEFEKKADKKLRGWAVFCSKYDDAAELLGKAANSYKLADSCDKAASAYEKLANCQLKLHSKDEAASAYLDAAKCYKKSQPLGQCITNLTTEIANIYQKEDIEKAMDCYDKAARRYSGEGQNITANECKIMVAQFAAQLEQYDKAIQNYEDVAREFMDNSRLFKYCVKGYLLNAGLCQICRQDVVGMNNALEKYQDLVGAIDEVDVVKFTDIVRDYDNKSRILWHLAGTAQAMTVFSELTLLAIGVDNWTPRGDMDEEDLGFWYGVIRSAWKELLIPKLRCYVLIPVAEIDAENCRCLSYLLLTH